MEPSAGVSKISIPAARLKSSETMKVFRPESLSCGFSVMEGEWYDIEVLDNGRLSELMNLA